MSNCPICCGTGIIGVPTEPAPSIDRRIVDFMVFTSSFAHEHNLMHNINNYLSRGWELHGTLHTTPTGFAQAMVRREKESL